MCVKSWSALRTLCIKLNGNAVILKMLFLLLASLLHIARGTYFITVFADVYKDKEFFTRTYPWIIDNIGGSLTVDYHLLGSGRYTVPQMCALSQMRSNTFLQAEYLKCEAEENPSEYCLCQTGIDPEEFKYCVADRGYLAADAAEEFTKVGIDVSPLVQMGPRSTVFKVEDTWFLKKICTIFGDDLPRGCVKPFACNGTDALHPKRALAQFHECCSKDCGQDPDPTTTPKYPDEYGRTTYYDDYPA